MSFQLTLGFFPYSIDMVVEETIVEGGVLVAIVLEIEMKMEGLVFCIQCVLGLFHNNSFNCNLIKTK